MSDDTTTWKLIHAERATLADALDDLTAAQWSAPSLCGGWTVQQAAAHVVAGAEQTKPAFVRGMAANGFRFNTMMDRDARRLGALVPKEIIARLRARTSTTNGPPAPAMTMLGEVVVHGEDIRRPLGLTSEPATAATIACLDMYKTASFPVGTKKRIAGLRLAASDMGWAHGDGPEVTGSGRSLLLAMTGRAAGLDGLTGEGAAQLRARLA
ncbi:MAG: hypothetical protein JWO68_3080 [Actinomycetia bacterium]|nr:hypothetical protein [Actinomycetes bacterium]